MKINRIVGRANKVGRVGLELEVEGKRFPMMANNRYWTCVEEGSLRGNCIEYILKNPVPLEGVKVAMKSLHNCFKKEDTVVIPTDRAGTHVHINVLDMEAVDVINFIILYLLFEEGIMRYCGDKRVGNLFCLRAKDAEGFIFCLEDALKFDHEFVRQLRSDMIRYSSINLKAIGKLGSLEFRGMRGTVDTDLIIEWVNLLCCLQDAAIELFKDPVEILNIFSGGGEDDFIKMVLPNHYRKISSDGMRENMWRVQPIIYSTDWDTFCSKEER